MQINFQQVKVMKRTFRITRIKETCNSTGSKCHHKRNDIKGLPIIKPIHNVYGFCHRQVYYRNNCQTAYSYKCLLTVMSLVPHIYSLMLTCNYGRFRSHIQALTYLQSFTEKRKGYTRE